MTSRRGWSIAVIDRHPRTGRVGFFARASIEFVWDSLPQERSRERLVESCTSGAAGLNQRAPDQQWIVQHQRECARRVAGARIDFSRLDPRGGTVEPGSDRHIPEEATQCLRAPRLIQNILGDHVVSCRPQRLHLARIGGAAGLLIENDCRHGGLFVHVGNDQRDAGGFENARPGLRAACMVSGSISVSGQTCMIALLGPAEVVCRAIRKFRSTDGDIELLKAGACCSLVLGCSVRFLTGHRILSCPKHPSSAALL